MIHIVSNYPKKPREVEYFWGMFAPGPAQTDDNIREVRRLFKLKQVKWYSIYELTLNKETGETTFKNIEHAAHEEVKPLELNVAAKGFVPPPLEPKKVKVTGGFAVPASFFQEMNPNKVAKQYIKAQVPMPAPEDGGF